MEKEEAEDIKWNNLGTEEFEESEESVYYECFDEAKIEPDCMN